MTVLFQYCLPQPQLVIAALTMPKPLLCHRADLPKKEARILLRASVTAKLVYRFDTALFQYSIMVRRIQVRAGRRSADHVDVQVSRSSSGAQRTGRKHAGRTADISEQRRGRRRDAAACLQARFQGVLIHGRVDDPEVVDAGIGLGRGTGTHEVRNRDRRQEADDGHNDHDLDQREAGFACYFERLHFVSSFLPGAA